MLSGGPYYTSVRSYSNREFIDWLDILNTPMPICIILLDVFPHEVKVIQEQFLDVLHRGIVTFSYHNQSV